MAPSQSLTTFLVFRLCWCRHNWALRCIHAVLLVIEILFLQPSFPLTSPCDLLLRPCRRPDYLVPRNEVVRLAWQIPASDGRVKRNCRTVENQAPRSR